MKVNISKSCEIPMLDLDGKSADFVISVIGRNAAEIKAVANPLCNIDERYPGLISAPYDIRDTSGFMAQKMRTNEL